MLKKCRCIIKYTDGTGAIGKYNLKHNLPFELREMEKWIMEKSKKPVKIVYCVSFNSKERRS